ncbi:CRISPR system precrRNA processing endoribonuclease RAMP protein Cas6 [Geotalea toluenoxydans]|uniref:CRISPR system precrRNA processing endoribonuclease RAMP protein Cas6 n=1 Tax=Geotalea toluenoxydans TaxID=421624 RepID=UPI0034E2D1B6
MESGHAGGEAERHHGRTAFSGDMDIFYPFLLLGQYFNIGKGASFGRGRYLMHGICR